MTADLASLEGLLARTALRVRLARGLQWACWACAVTATSTGTWLWFVPSARWTIAVAAALSALCFLVGSSLRVPRARVSAAINRAGALDGRVRAADEFLELAPAERTAFVLAALRDASARARHVRAAQAVPFRRPRGAVPALFALLACGLISTRSSAVAPRPTPVAQGTPLPLPRVLAVDELAAREETARSLSARAPSSTSVQQRLADYLTLLAQLEAGTLSQEAALQQALALEARLGSAARTHDASETANIEQLARELAKAHPELARALSGGAWAEAARQLRALAAQTAQQELDEAQRARLSAALRKAREREHDRVAEQEREQALERALSAGRESGEPSLLKRRDEQRRELDTLRRRRAAQPKRTLERLERELARLGSALSDDDTAEARDALERAADALEQHEREQRDDRLERELARELAQLREQLQQRALAQEREEPASRPEPTRRERSVGQTLQEQGSDPAARQLRFDLEARGQRGPSPDGGAASQLTVGGGSGGSSQQLLLGESARGAIVTRELPRATETRSRAEEPRATETRSRAEEPRASTGGGAEHDPRQLAAPTRSGGHYEDSALSAASGAGPSRSQVIRSAAQGGFASAPYRKVYADYRAHEEAVLERERVPAGYRYHVRRYFELVRPRAGQDGRR